MLRILTCSQPAVCISTYASLSLCSVHAPCPLSLSLLPCVRPQQRVQQVMQVSLLLSLVQLKDCTLACCPAPPQIVQSCPIQFVLQDNNKVKLTI